MSSKLNEYYLKLGIILMMASYTLALNVDKKDPKNKIEVNKDSFGICKICEAITTLFLSGLFDRSFFITAFMAIKYSKLAVLISGTLALTLVGILSVFLGMAINKYVPTIWIDVFSVALFLFFGVKMIIEAYNMNKNEDLVKLEQHYQNRSDEEENVNTQEDTNEERTMFIESRKCGDVKNNNASAPTNGHGHIMEVQKECEDIDKSIDNKLNNGYSSNFKVASKIFLLIFASEIGDRSQISTIFLTNNFDKMVVIAAVFISQLLLTIIAIFGGALISTKISERTLTFIAGATFLAFGLVAFYLVLVNDIFTHQAPKVNYTNDVIPDRRNLIPNY